MKKTLTALAAAGLIAMATAALPTDANAYCRGCGVGAGIIGGLAAGAIIGGAIASQPAYAPYAPVSGYEPYGAYAAPGPVACPGGYWARRPIYDRWGNNVGWSRPRFFCPAY
jgi:hypothetical protein